MTLAPVFRLLTVSWWALALSWAADGIWPHAAVTFAVGLACHLYAEHLAFGQAAARYRRR